MCLAEDVDPVLASALADELEQPIVVCTEASTAPRLSLVLEPPVAPVVIVATHGDRRVIRRTPQPLDVMGPRALAVWVRATLDELAASEPPLPNATASASSAITPAARASASASSASTPAARASAAPPTPAIESWSVGVLAAIGLDVGWGDVTVAAQDESLTYGPQAGGELRAHHESGHGLAAGFRLRLMNAAQFAIDVRYSYRWGTPTRSTGLAASLFVDAGLLFVRGLHEYFTPEVALTAFSIADRYALGASATATGALHIGPIVLALIASGGLTINPWGAQDLWGRTGAEDPTLGARIDLLLAAGTYFAL